MKTYKSKIGTGILLFLIAIVVGIGIPLIYFKIWIGIILLFLIAVFILHLFLTTCYTVKDNILKIKSGFFFKKSLDINEIKKVSESRNSLSSPANSLDRLEIIYGEKESILISPKDKVDFVECLIAINPHIEIVP